MILYTNRGNVVGHLETLLVYEYPVVIEERRGFMDVSLQI